jgi:hypothetical protein
MSIEIMNAVWRESKSDGRARLVLLAIADHQGEIGAWPSIRRLAQMVNSSERSVQRDIQYLQKIGELIVEVQNAPTSGQYKSNRYWVNLPGVTDSVSGVTESQSGVTNRASGVTADGVQTLIEPLQEPINTHEELFKEFWKEYPRRLDKGAAFRAFKSALKRAKFEDILAGVIAYKNDPTRKPEYTKYPASWLNADSWENAATLPEAKAANEARRKKEIEASQQYIREMEELAKRSVPLTPELKRRLGL